MTAPNVKRDMDYGILQLGDPGVKLNGQTVKGPRSVYQFSCYNINANKEFTVHNHGLHMHSTGAKMKTVHYRALDTTDTTDSGEEVVVKKYVAIGKAEIEYYVSISLARVLLSPSLPLSLSLFFYLALSSVRHSRSILPSQALARSIVRSSDADMWATLNAMLPCRNIVFGIQGL